MSHFYATQDLAQRPTRRLKKQYNNAGTAIDKASGTDAVGITAPASLTGASLNEDIAMGIVPSTGIVSFIHNGTTQDFTIYFYSKALEKAVGTAGSGWYLGAESNALNTKNVLQNSLASFKGPVGAPWFLKAATTADITILLTNAPEHPKNPNTDPTHEAG